MNSKQKPVAIITGASGGIGLTLALVNRGYDLVGTSRSISNYKEAESEF
jgi:short-subunit dehydrogenase